MLILKKEFFERIAAHGKREFPNEACGLLAGRDSRVERVYEMTNADKSRATFLMDPAEQLKALKEIRGLNLEMLGIYHSHVASQAYPSSHDVAMAYYPDVSYVIVSLKDNNPSMRAFRIAEGKITEEELKIVS
ncbi:MAG: hypothetical protein A2987_03595 [Omnitrophica bacterium RIFCSPLOWO2_01_FULL_45_10]|nr:MAG: hypothetical protein A2987_03595 [Omnitrophica bacterium RIFCSPLOWO2_01_FULL_45_10]